MSSVFRGLRYVLISAFCDPLSVSYMGYTREAVEKKIEKGTWRLNREYIKAPDGHIMIDLEGVTKWAESLRAAA